MAKKIDIQSLSFTQTNLFNNLTRDYLNKKPELKDLYYAYPNKAGILKRLKSKKNKTHRKLLQSYFIDIYKTETLSKEQKKNISILNDANTYTVCCAHQPNIFLGYLYTIYKIIHTIKLANDLSNTTHKIIPVFFMGSEDADFEELSVFNLPHQSFQWQTEQRGVFGRLKPEGLKDILKNIELYLKELPHGEHLFNIINEAYNKDNIQECTFNLINTFFKEQGLLIITPDNRNLKQVIIPFIKKDLLSNDWQKHLQKNITKLSTLKYKIQATDKKNNFFYLINTKREKIEFFNNYYYIVNSDIKFSPDELAKEIELYPERFSPNLFMRALMQEYILPNIVFIGGSGEVSYWLQLKSMFDYYKVDYPILMLRNSFVIIDNLNTIKKIKKNNWQLNDFFIPDDIWIKTNVINSLNNKKILQQIKNFRDTQNKKYLDFKVSLKKHTPSLAVHLSALQKKNNNDINKLEQKLIKAHKIDFQILLNQKQSIQENIFPNGIFQERYLNFIYFYGKYGPDFFKQLYELSHCYDPKITMLLIEE